jgi:hypothetical protein
VSYDDFSEAGEFTSGGHARRDIEADLRDLIELVANAKQMPLSNSALVSRDDVLNLLEQALRNIPDEIREARWALRDREELMASEMQKAQQLMDQVRAEAARMVDKTEIVRQSRLRADQIIAEAQTRARQMINQSEDFIDGKLGSFEIVLERLLRTARSGRERLSAQGLPTSLVNDEPIDTLLPPAAPLDTYDERPEEAPSSFFDQDAF